MTRQAEISILCQRSRSIRSAANGANTGQNTSA